MDVDEEDLKEIAKFLPMLQGATREYPPAIFHPSLAFIDPRTTDN
jgi:hypothetical protein